ncbi:helix-turn-helix domain-containing protein [Streptomyces sp. DT117]|uniref:helix-turn-helix domain-containing protein n=1 Tax=Streptomyces sp. DT117 TaxID=3393422 RepID=UPI003CF7CB62
MKFLDPPDEIAVAENMQRLREAQGLSQDALAARTDGSFNEVAVWLIENHSRRITNADLTVLANALQVSPDDLLRRPSKEPRREP